MYYNQLSTGKSKKGDEVQIVTTMFHRPRVAGIVLPKPPSLIVTHYKHLQNICNLGHRLSFCYVHLVIQLVHLLRRHIWVCGQHDMKWYDSLKSGCKLVWDFRVWESESLIDLDSDNLRLRVWVCDSPKE